MTLSVQNLCFSYDRHASVLDGIDFSIDRGQFIGIFGPNGGGKTTLLQLLLGLLVPTRGTIRILNTLPSEASSRIGYVPQVRRFDKQFPISVMEIVLHGSLAKHRGWGNFSRRAKERALVALERVGLQDSAHQAFGALSGGQIQRVLIARALVSDPEILLLDEATVGVDPQALAEIFQFLIGLKGEITILMVTHDLGTIAKAMDHLFCINKQLTHYTPEQVCEHFAMGLYHPRLMNQGDRND